MKNKLIKQLELEERTILAQQKRLQARLDKIAFKKLKILKQATFSKQNLSKIKLSSGKLKFTKDRSINVSVRKLNKSNTAIKREKKRLTHFKSKKQTSFVKGKLKQTRINLNRLYANKRSQNIRLGIHENTGYGKNAVKKIDELTTKFYKNKIQNIAFKQLGKNEVSWINTNNVAHQALGEKMALYGNKLENMYGGGGWKRTLFKVFNYKMFNNGIEFNKFIKNLDNYDNIYSNLATIMGKQIKYRGYTHAELVVIAKEFTNKNYEKEYDTPH